jgi:hypothetical protein
MIRRDSVFRNSISFDSSQDMAEDYKFWNDLLLVGEAALIPEPLLFYGRGGVSRIPASRISQTRSVARIRRLSLHNWGLPPEDEIYIRLLTGEAALTGCDLTLKGELSDFLSRFISVFVAKGFAYDRGARAFILFLLLRLRMKRASFGDEEDLRVRHLIMRYCKPESLSLFVVSYLSRWGTLRLLSSLRMDSGCSRR